MAIQNRLGRVQGASMFVTTVDAYDGVSTQNVSRSDIFPAESNGIKPMVGDCIVFANGVVGTVSNVQSSTTIICKPTLFSLKGKDGLNITSVEQTTTSDKSGGINVVTFTLSDGTKHNVQISNGKEGGIGVDDLVLKNENGIDTLFLSKQGETVGNGIVFPQGGAGGTNYIANSNFAINQRGKNTYDEQGTGRVYTLDRWAKNCTTGEFFVKQLDPSLGGVVPNDGRVVNTVYFNTSLTQQQVKDIIDNANLPFVEVAGMSSLPVYAVCIANNVGLCILKGSDFYTIGWQNLADGTEGMIYSTYSGEWVETSLDFNGNSTSEFMGMQLGTHNDKLVQLISVSPAFVGANTGSVYVGGTFAEVGEIFVQPVEGKLVADKTVTFSMQISSLSGGFLVGMVAKKGNVTKAEQYVVAQQGVNSVTFAIPQGATQVVCGLFNANVAGSEFSAVIDWAKLEVGVSATQYLQPLPAMDVAECQRFYQGLTYKGAVGFAKDENTCELTLHLPTAMRKTPAIDTGEKMYIKNAFATAVPSITKTCNNCLSLSFATENLVPDDFYFFNDYDCPLDAEIYEDE